MRTSAPEPLNRELLSNSQLLKDGILEKKYCLLTADNYFSSMTRVILAVRLP